MVLVFGLAFELPLLLIMLNLVGIVSGRRMIGWWRAVVMGVFVFGAVATPTTDPVGMIALSETIILLYFVAVAFSLVNDKRRARRGASPANKGRTCELDLTPEAVEPVEPVAALPEQATKDRVNGYDDVT
ncbi:Sec-independent protein translocase protein TatC OS=Streptomyces tendae OX=1932 GN=tatC PE=3 SV=1 [Streptomyces tendae]